ncbi:MAG TPA: alpha/beta hydrolase [Pyrinomonadaceae bacterium]|nr:alpha/beta hydrolase [Pyrinomonadaceae bacterium]
MKKRNIALAFGAGVGAAVAVKMLTRPDTVDFEKVADQVPHSDKSKFITVDGIRVHYQEFGDAAAPPMLLIHGYTASVYVWKTVAPIFADAGYRVIAVDLVGYGYSEKPSWFDYSIQSQARMLSRFLERLGIGRTVVVGSSYGGAVALNLTLDNAEKVEKLVLVDAVINDDQKNHPILRLAAIPGIGEALTPFLCDSRFFHRIRMNGTLAKANHQMITPERIDSVIRPLAAADGHRSVLATSRNWDANRLEQDAHLINQPTLIIWGDSDSVIPIENGYKLHDSILNSRFVIFNQCGHVPQEEKSEMFTELVTEFVQDRKGRISAPEDSQLVA